MRNAVCLVILTIVSVGCPSVLHAQGSAEDYARAASFDKRTRGRVFRDRIRPQWNAEGTGFWYQVEVGRDRFEYVQVDVASGTRKVVSKDAVVQGGEPRVGIAPADAPRSRDRGGETELVFLNRSGGAVKLFWRDRSGGRQQYGEILAGQKRSQHTFIGHSWIITDMSGRDLVAFVADGNLALAEIGPDPVERSRASAANGSKDGETPKPRWSARLRRGAIVLKDDQANEERVFSNEGSDGLTYAGPLVFSPDQRYLAALRRTPGESHEVSFVESSPSDQIQPKLHQQNYMKPGDRLSVRRPCLFEVESGAEVSIDSALFPNPWSVTELSFSADSRELRFLYNERGHQVLRVVGIDVETGSPRAIVDERSATFIDYAQKKYLRWIGPSRELLWMSERDGFNHLYLYDVARGSAKRAVTEGDWVVREVLSVDEETREAWLFVGGIHPDQDPYHRHLLRVSLDGGDPVVLTEGDGDHEIEFSPDRQYFIDRWSRVDQPPITELRRSSDGQKMVELEKADISALLESGWTMPRRFHAKGRDGVTDIYGLVVTPSNFDPAKRYPVVEQIYAGPHGAHVPKRFSRLSMQHRMSELGFLLVQIDGMGTNHRSKAFHDVCWRNLADAGFPDRIAWMRALSKEVPQMDLDRVGIYGGSAGGQNSMRALIDHGDVYKVAVSDCGCHDNRMDKVWWNELWMGYPVGPWYEESSNVAHAHRMQGDLLLIVGELDRNVDPASTMQVVDALIRADKDFEMLVIPGAGHGAAGTSYGARRQADFLVRNLHGVSPRWE